MILKEVNGFKTKRVINYDNSFLLSASIANSFELLILLYKSSGWAFDDKSTNIAMLKKQIDNPQFAEWVTEFDKKDFKQFKKQNKYGNKT